MRRVDSRSAPLLSKRLVAIAGLSVALLTPAASFVAPPRGAEAGPVSVRVSKKRAARRTSATLLKLRKQRVASVTFDDVTLDGAIKWLRVATGHNYVVKKATILKAGIDLDEIRYKVQLSDVKLTTLLGILCDPHGLAVVVKDNVVFITTKKASYGKPITRMYAISHITYQKTDFPAPDMNLRPSGWVPTEEYTPEVPVEDDPLTDPEAVVELIKQMVASKAWDDNDDWRISASSRWLIVRAPASVHRAMPRAIQQVASFK